MSLMMLMIVVMMMTLMRMMMMLTKLSSLVVIRWCHRTAHTTNSTFPAQQNQKLRRKMEFFFVSMSVELLYNQFAQYLEFVYFRWQVLNIFDCGHHKRLVTWPKWRAIWQCKRAWESELYYLKNAGFCGETLHETYSPPVEWSLKTIPPNAPCPLPSLPSSLIFQPTFNLTELSAFFEANNFASSQKASEQKIIRRSSPSNFPFQNYQSMYINIY